ncbi:MAG: hypothetical protein RXP97_06155 [Nitrososphaeria archaeon]
MSSLAYGAAQRDGGALRPMFRRSVLAAAPIARVLLMARFAG